MIDIRQAEKEDFAAILRMLVAMHAEVGEFPISVDKVARRIDETLAYGVVLLAEVKGEPAGTIGLRAEAPWYSEQTVICDTWIWTQGRRRVSVFARLVKEAHDYALRLETPCVLTLYSLKQTASKRKLFERFGRQIMEGYQFKPAGGDFRTGKEA